MDLEIYQKDHSIYIHTYIQIQNHTDTCDVKKQRHLHYF